MSSPNRDATLKRTEKLLRQGKLDDAIAEYVRLVEDQPCDWASINTLGDLWVRAGDPDRAVELFTRVADFLCAEGFLSKAQAVYKKALKLHSTDEHTLLQLAEIASRQGLLLDARQYFRLLAEQRRFRGDARGAAECVVWLGLLEDADTEAKIAAVQAAETLGDTPLVTALLDDPEMLLALAGRALAAGQDEQARRLLTGFLMRSPDRGADVMRLAARLVEGAQPDRAFACVDIVADAALLEGDLSRATDALRQFTSTVSHIPALAKLVDLCVDAGFHDLMREAQARLADAYLAAGRTAEAHAIAEDLAAAREEDLFADLGAPETATVVEAIEIDLSGALGEMEAATTLPPDLESVFEELRAKATREQEVSDAHAEYALALQHWSEGREVEAIAALERAVRVPALRFHAGGQLGRLLIARGDVSRGIEWLKRAAEAPAPSPEEGFVLLYDLAVALETTAESARALAILLELEADAAGYRDVGARIARLTRVQAGSSS